MRIHPLTFLIALTAGLLAPSAARAQAAAPAVFCVYEQRTDLAGKIIKQFTVMRCEEGDRVGGLARVRDGGPMPFLAALALRGTLFAADEPEVWCVGRRFGAQAKVGDAIKVREDQATPVAAASTSGWIYTCGLTSDEADAMIATINASLQGARDWCVLSRRITVAGQTVVQAAMVHISQFIAMATRPDFIMDRCDLTFDEAALLKASLESKNPTATLIPSSPPKPPTQKIWCLLRRNVTVENVPVQQAVMVRCTDAERAGPGWAVVDGPAPLDRAIRGVETYRDTATRTLTSANCAKILPFSAPTKPAADGTYRCECPVTMVQSGGRCVLKDQPVVAKKDEEKKKEEEQKRKDDAKPPAGALAMSGPPVVKTGSKGGYGAVQNSNEFTATTARQIEVDGTVYRREIEWSFTPAPATLTPGQEISITVTGKARVTDKGADIKLPVAASAGVRARGLEQVKGELATADTGSAKASTFVFRVPKEAKGATISFGADYNLGVFATYYYGDHKP